MAKIGLDDYWEYYRDTSEMLGKCNAKFDCGADKRTCINKFWKEEKAKRIAAEEKARQDRAAREDADNARQEAEEDARRAREAEEHERRVKEKVIQEQKKKIEDIERRVNDIFKQM